jgi:hypothetical protein
MRSKVRSSADEYVWKFLDQVRDEANVRQPRMALEDRCLQVPSDDEAQLDRLA